MAKRKPARGRKKAAPARKPRRPAGKKKTKPTALAINPAKVFEQAVGFASTGYVFDAIAAFKKSAETDPRGALADDAYYNIGLCYFELKLYHEAIEYFTRVIQGYPQATIHATAGAQESGRTAAKAHLGRLRAYLALGRRDEAQKELDELNKYPDSSVLDAQGVRKTFYELALEALKQQPADKVAESLP
ncbi:MAG: tetratricopeptide repeat protein [Planctomycetes bacterium]|nr:tetratricopeptide repeat protein [Planctomycetota bacterium]